MDNSFAAKLLQTEGEITLFELRTLLGLVAAVTISSNPLYADEAADKMVDEALPHMYHTCASVVEEAGGDEDMVVTVVGKITALSLYNRDIDIAQFATTDAQKNELSEAFLAEIAKGCGADQNALLGGVVDDAVKNTLGL